MYFCHDFFTFFEVLFSTFFHRCSVTFFADDGVGQFAPELLGLFHRNKQEYIYLNPENDILQLHKGIDQYIQYYNTKRPHQGLDNHAIPINFYKNKKEDAA